MSVTSFSPLVDVAVPGGERRVAGVIGDETVVVALMNADGVAREEYRFALNEAAELAQQCLAGDRRALTRPGLARILSSAVAVLFRVSLASGGLQRVEETDERRNGGDRGTAAEAAGAGDAALSGGLGGP